MILANISGTPYHMLNLIALMGELPTSSPVAGLFLRLVLSRSKREMIMVMKKLSGQVQYLSNNLGPIKQYLDSLLSKPSDLGSDRRINVTIYFYLIRLIKIL